MQKIITALRSEANRELREMAADVSLLLLLALFLLGFQRAPVWIPAALILSALLAGILIVLTLRRVRIRKFIQSLDLKEPQTLRICGNLALMPSRWVSWYRGKGVEAAYSQVAKVSLYRQTQGNYMRSQKLKQYQWRLQITCHDGRYTVISLIHQADAVKIMQFLASMNPGVRLIPEPPHKIVTLEELPQEARDI